MNYWEVFRASQGGGLDSIQLSWDLWWTKWYETWVFFTTLNLLNLVLFIYWFIQANWYLFLSWHQYRAFLLFTYNSTNDCTISILLLHIVTYDSLLHVSTLIRHLQRTFWAWLKLHRLLILIKCNCQNIKYKV